MAWPKTVPVLEASDMCIGPLKRGSCGCLSFWRSEVFAGASLDQWDKVVVASAKAADEIGIPRTTTHSDIGTVTTSQAARVANRTHARLGYIYDAKTGKVVNPECRKDGTLKPV